MKNRIIETLNKLMLIHGPSGHEQSVATELRNRFRNNNFEVIEDVQGNCIGFKKGAGNQNIMIFAHMDSVGFLVKKIDENGYIKFERLGGIPEKILPALKVQIKTRNGDLINGYIMVKAHHLTSAEEKYKVDSYKNLYIDIGVNSKQEVLDLGIMIGDPITYYPDFNILKNDKICGTFADNRRGCAILMLLSDYLKDKEIYPNIYLVGTVQEEFSIRGAVTAANRIKPDIAICVDGAASHDVPGLEGEGELKLGHGPVMTLYNFHGRGTLNGSIAHPVLVNMFIEVACQNNIPIQHVASLGFLTDLAYVQYTNNGVAGIDLGIPSRNGHSPVEVIDIDDVLNLIKLLEKFLASINKEISLERREVCQ